MKQIFTTLFACFIIKACAQQYDATWVLGTPNTVYKFDSSSIYVADTFPPGSSMYYFISSGCMSDRNGNLLYISNGLEIRDRNDSLMQGGDQFELGSYYTTTDGYDFNQSPLSLPMPGSDSLYYIFYEAYWDTSLEEGSRLYYGIIDMSANNGLGKVISLNNILIDGFITDGGLSACKHANGIDWWLIKPKYQSNEYYRFLVKGNGVIVGSGIQNSGIASSPPDYNNQLVFSPDGSKVFFTNASQKAILFDFDRCTGYLSNPRYVWGIDESQTIGAIGASFSASSRFLYLTGDSFKLYQIDTYADDIQDSKTVLARFSQTQNNLPSFHQLAPNGKIYIEGYGSPTPLTIINYPDSSGFSCGLDTFAYDTLPWYTFAVPKFPYYRTPPARVYQAGVGHDTTICIGDTVLLGEPAVDSVSYRWQSSPGLLSNTDIAQPLAAPAQTTTYYLTMTDTVPHGYSCNVRTDSITVQVVPLPCILSAQVINTMAAGIRVFPNPASDMVNIGYSVNCDAPVSILVGNVLGQVIYTQPIAVKSGVQPISVIQYAPGVYTVYLKQGNVVLATSKFVLAH